jgi:hypothetical protein
MPELWMEPGNGVARRCRTTVSQFPARVPEMRPTSMRVTLTGTFFAGHRMDTSRWGGFGHVGRCSLLVIQRIDGFEAIQ